MRISAIRVCRRKMGVLLRFWIRTRVCAVLEGEIEWYEWDFFCWNTSFGLYGILFAMLSCCFWTFWSSEIDCVDWVKMFRVAPFTGPRDGCLVVGG